MKNILFINFGWQLYYECCFSIKFNGVHIKNQWQELLRLKVAFWLAGGNQIQEPHVANKVVHSDILRCHMDGVAFCCNISDCRGKHISSEPGGLEICHLWIHVYLINTLIFSSGQCPVLMFFFFFFSWLAGTFKLHTLAKFFFLWKKKHWRKHNTYWVHTTCNRRHWTWHLTHFVGEITRPQKAKVTCQWFSI